MNKHLYKNSEVIYCAESLDRCWELFEEDTGHERAHDEEGDPFVQIPDEEDLEIGCDEPSGEPGEVARDYHARDTKEVLGQIYYLTKTAGEWAKEYNGEGHFSGGDL